MPTQNQQRIEAVGEVASRLFLFEESTTEAPPMILKGVVKSGQGNFGYWIEKLANLYRAKTGMALYPGTLNVQLREPYTLPRERIRLEGSEYGGAVCINIVPCKIFGRAAFILRTDANDTDQGDHPRSVIEIATDVRLRDVYGLNDGDAVEVEVA